MVRSLEAISDFQGKKRVCPKTVETVSTQDGSCRLRGKEVPMTTDPLLQESKPLPKPVEIATTNTPSVWCNGNPTPLKAHGSPVWSTSDTCLLGPVAKQHLAAMKIEAHFALENVDLLNSVDPHFAGWIMFSPGKKNEWRARGKSGTAAWSLGVMWLETGLSVSHWNFTPAFTEYCLKSNNCFLYFWWCLRVLLQ